MDFVFGCGINLNSECFSRRLERESEGERGRARASEGARARERAKREREREREVHQLMSHDNLIV